MWKNFILVAVRNISKNKSFTFINVAGLTIGISSAILIILFIISELSHDRIFTDSDRIFRLYIDGKMANTEIKGAWTSPPAGPVFMKEIPEITEYTRIARRGQVLVKIEDKKYLEESMVFADSGFFNLFDITVIYGDPSTMLKEPNSLVLTETLANKYFGNVNPVGIIVETDADTSMFTVTGVISDLPDETHLTFNLIASFSTHSESRSTYWLTSYLFTYVKLERKESVASVESQMRNIIRDNIGPQLNQMMGIDLEEFEASGNRYEMFLQPLNDIHLNSEIQGGFKPTSDRKYLKIFGFIAVFIILIGSINFMNMATAKASQRAKEVGMRKITGSGRGLIIRQFLWESIFLSILSLLFSIIIIEIILPFFNSMMELNLKMQYLSTWYTLPGLFLLAVFVGLLSGSYPALILSSYKPVDALKGRITSGIAGVFVRNILVVVQFTISIIIITGTIVIFTQLQYVMKKDLGFTRENILVLYRLDPIRTKLSSFIQELEKVPSNISASNSTIYAGSTNTSNSYQIKDRETTGNYIFSTYWTDPEFFSTYDIKLTMGRYFDRDMAADTNAILVNEIALEKYEIQDPLNTVFIQPADDGIGRELKIIGVVKSFHSASLHEEIFPVVFQMKTERHYPGYISVKLEEEEESILAAVNQIKKIWADFTDDEPMQYFFLNERLQQLYREEQRSGKLALAFSLLAIFLACLGLYGLMMYTTQRRAKEISIRKVHGASKLRIVLLIIQDVSGLLVLSAFIAWPFSWKIAGSWLEDFAYRIDLSPFIFISGAILAFLIALITVSAQAYSAAQAKCARLLRYE